MNTGLSATEAAMATEDLAKGPVRAPGTAAQARALQRCEVSAK